MIYQNDSALSERMQKSGCFIRSSFLVAELKTGKVLDAKLINILENLCIERGYVDDAQYSVKVSAPIIQLAFEYLGEHRKVIEIGTSRDGEDTLYQWARGSRIDARIQKIRQPGPQKYHFRVMEEGRVYDPHDPQITSLGEEYSILYRIII